MKRLLILSLAGIALASAPLIAMDDDRPGPGPGGPGMQDGRGPGGPGMDGPGGPGMQDGRGPGGPGMGPGMNGPDPSTMKAELGLSDAQVAKLKALRKQRQEDRKSMRSMRDLRQKLEDQVEDKASDADIAATLKQLDAAQAQMREMQEKFRADCDAVLTPTQRAKLMVGRFEKGKERREQRREDRKERRQERRDGRPGQPMSDDGK